MNTEKGMTLRRESLKKRAAFRRFINKRPFGRNIVLERLIMTLSWLPALVLCIGVFFNTLPAPFHTLYTFTIQAVIIIFTWIGSAFLIKSDYVGKNFDVSDVFISNLNLITALIVTVGIIQNLAIPWSERSGQVLIASMVMTVVSCFILAIAAEFDRASHGTLGIVIGIVLSILVIRIFGITDSTNVFLWLLKGLVIYLAVAIVIFVLFFASLIPFALFENSKIMSMAKLLSFPIGIFTCFLLLFFMGGSMLIVTALSNVVDHIPRIPGRKGVLVVSTVIALSGNVILIWFSFLKGWQVLSG